jgi:hypothetical protein
VRRWQVGCGVLPIKPDRRLGWMIGWR